DDLLAPGEVDQQIGTYPVLAHLRVEVAVPDHPGELDDPFELDLAPSATDLRRTQRGDQLLGAGGQQLRRAVHALDLLAQPGVGVHAVAFDVLDLPGQRAHGLVQRADEPRHLVADGAGRPAGGV